MWVSNEIIKFTYVISSEGGGYDSSTGIFTVPHNGVYVFICNIATLNNGYIARLVVNGIPKVGAAASIDYRTDTSNTNVYNAAGNTVILQLHDGDRVWMSHRSNTQMASLWTNVYFPFSTFSGYLLSQGVN